MPTVRGENVSQSNIIEEDKEFQILTEEVKILEEIINNFMWHWYNYSLWAIVISYVH